MAKDPLAGPNLSELDRRCPRCKALTLTESVGPTDRDKARDLIIAARAYLEPGDPEAVADLNSALEYITPE